MKRRELLATTAALAFLHGPATSEAAASKGSPDRLDHGYDKLIELILLFMRPLRELGDNIDRDKLISALNAFAVTLESLRMDKLSIIHFLNRAALPDEFGFLVSRFKENLQTCMERAPKLTSALRQEHQPRGNEVATKLQHVLNARFNWLHDVKRVTRASPMDQKLKLAEQGTALATKLASASEKLGEVIGKLRSE